MLSNKELDQLIICPKCATLHKKVILQESNKAICSVCHSTLYRKHPKLLDKSLALSLTSLIFFIIANSFPIINIDLGGVSSSINLTSAFLTMIEQQYYFVGILSAFVIFIIPLLLILDFLLLLIFMKLKIYEKSVEKMLIFLARILPWNMMEIFLVSILVALVKLIGYAEINFGISFWALVLFVIVDLYMAKNISLLALWSMKEKIYEKQK